MQLNFRSFSQTVSAMAAAVQGASKTPLNLTVGSVLRALLEAMSGLALWLQWNAALILSAARLSTSKGADVDSFVEQFTFERLPAKPASGQATFSRYLPTNAATVPVGAIVKTVDGSQTFAVIADTSNSAYSASAGGYVIGAGVSSVSATIQAVTAGIGGNVLAGTIGVIASAIPGVDDVTNPQAFTNGADAETDSSCKSRFHLWLPSLAKSTPDAIKSAALGTQQNITVDVLENSSAIPRNTAPGYSVVAIDDGTGATPAQVLSAVQAAVDAVAGLGTTLYVRQAQVVDATISLSVTPASAESNVNSALSKFVSSLPVSAPLPFYRLAQVAWDADPTITAIENVTLNGSNVDIGGTRGTVVRINSLAVN